MTKTKLIGTVLVKSNRVTSPFVRTTSENVIRSVPSSNRRSEVYLAMKTVPAGQSSPAAEGPTGPADGWTAFMKAALLNAKMAESARTKTAR